MKGFLAGRRNCLDLASSIVECSNEIEIVPVCVRYLGETWDYVAFPSSYLLRDLVGEVGDARY